MLQELCGMSRCAVNAQAFAARSICTEASVALQVRYLKVIEKSGYQALPWVRYITTGGEYEIRMA